MKMEDVSGMLRAATKTDIDRQLKAARDTERRLVAEARGRLAARLRSNRRP